MSDSDVFVGSRPERSSLVAKPWCFAAAVSLGLHAVIVVWIADRPTPIGMDSDVAINAVEVEFVVPDVARAISPSIAGKLAAGPRQEAAIPPIPAAIEQTPGNGVALEPKPKPMMVAAPPVEAPSVIEPPVATAPPGPAATAHNGLQERIRPDAGTPVGPAKMSTAASPPDDSPAETKRRNLPPRPAKPIASAPKQPTIEHRADGRAPKPGRRPQAAPIALPANRTTNLPGNPGQAGSAGVGQAMASTTNKRDALALYLASVKSWIADQQSHTLGPERGQVEIHFSVAADGRLGNLKVEKSDNDSLDEEALKIVRRSSPVAPIPPSTGKTSLNMSVTIEFR